ncbi:MAG: hypothetical protein KC616_25380, partial [Myxococcales bacterium]|nr:hypothetical protein [Myxococcales bacterium]
MPFHRLPRRSGSLLAHRSIGSALARDRVRRSTRLVLLASLLGVVAATSAAATPYPTPRSADELACNLARSRNGDDYRAWWDRIRGSSTYRDWFWNRIVPRRTDGACAAEVEQMFWQEAVPGNWSSVPALAGWDWPSGGYFTQTLWLQAIPGNWASGPAQSGWSWSSGGYYTQTFWLRAVPDGWGPRSYTLGTLRDQSYYRYFFWTGAVAKNWGPRGYSLGRLSGQGYYRFWLWQAAVPENWASQPRERGWPWTTGGYYTQALWLHAIPENWRAWDGETGSLGRDYYATGGQGHYRVYFWEYAVPDNWVTQGDRVGGWPWGSGGYYTQFFWWRAVPEDWAPGADQSIGGIPGQGHYAFWLYHFAAPRGFAWRSGWSVRGSRDASYYLFFLHEVFPSVHAEYAGLARLTSGHLEGAGAPAPVRDWFDDSASAVVVLTFDTEGNAEQSCRVASLLRDEGVDATFFVEGGAA